MRCTLETFSLDAYPPYYALSYTWASPFPADHSDRAYSRTYPISINSKTYEVTKNLHEALLQLRLSCAGSYVWIDAVCIWRANLQERNSQVDLMSEIYGKAAKVLIWLGVSDADTVSVAHLIILLASVSERTAQLLEKRLQDFGKMCDEEGDPFEKLGLPGCRSPMWLSLASLFQRSYIQRVWVLQENALAREAQVYCGAVTFNASQQRGHIPDGYTTNKCYRSSRITLGRRNKPNSRCCRFVPVIRTINTTLKLIEYRYQLDNLSL